MMLTKMTPMGEWLGFDPALDLGRWPREFGLNAHNTLYPRFDVLERDGDYEIKADLPGVKRDDIQVHLDGNAVEIVADFHRDEGEERDGKLVRSERRQGLYRRRLALADKPDAAKAKAAYQDGVLTITLPKSKNDKRKRLEVH